MTEPEAPHPTQPPRDASGSTGGGLDGGGLDGAGLDGAGLDGAGLDGAGLDGARLDGAGAEFLASVGRRAAPAPSADGAPPAGRRRRERSGTVEALVLVLLAFLLALTLKTYVAEAYEIKGRSMEPTFRDQQRVVVLKAFYDLARGDIIVFSSLEDPDKDLIKRVVGLPGEVVSFRGGRVYVDGELLEEAYARPGRAASAETSPPEEVPGDSYYVLGDNRPDSHDSRYFHAIPASSIKGKVVVRWWPLAEFCSF